MEARKKKDKLSTRAAEIHRYAELAKDIPDVRREKIEAIKKQIETDMYDVSAESVARSVADLHRSLKANDKSRSRQGCGETEPKE